uniref:Uncharacterized protein n=1 Tax=Leersia perrieri TaxID=77586 RepID=A0A0D9VZI4_9ORYZ
MVMEIPCSKRETARGAEAEEVDSDEEYDRVFYEDIEAPKFVDLTAPDAARPSDDPSWFCLRIGCDQNHEQVDPEALHRSFFMRVMAARSPNVRLQKAIRRRNESSMLKCPHTAPPKPPRARFARLSTAAEAAAAKPRLKTHRICTLRASPTKAAKIEASSARKKALTTPRSKPVLRPRPELFLSAKHQKEPVAAAAAAAAVERKGNNNTVVKALFMATPKKDAGQKTPAKSQPPPPPPLSEVCSKMRKMNLACREVPSRYLCQSTNQKTAKKCDQTAVKSAKKVQWSRPDVKKKKILGCSLKHVSSEVGKENRNGREDAAAGIEIASSDQERKEVLQESRIEVEASQADNYEDDKENLSYVDQPTEQAVIVSHSEGKNMQPLENNENVPHKVTKMLSKVNPEQAGKLKKTTNPKPFRLRTDERSVLKEANSESHQTLTENNTMAALKDGNRAVLQVGRCHDGKGQGKTICREKQKKQIRNVATAQLDEAKRVLKSIPCNNVKPALANGKTVGRSQRAPRVPSSTRSTNITSGSMPTSRIGKEKKTSVKMSRIQAAAA